MRWWMALGWGIFLSVHAQVVRKVPLKTERRQLAVPALRPLAIVLEAPRADVSPYVVEAMDTVRLVWDEPVEGEVSRFTFPVFIREGVDMIEVHSSPSTVLYFLYVPPLSAPVVTSGSGAGGPCDSPSWIAPSQWRAGLSPPTTKPVATPTHHVIVHHSASVLSDSDYVKMIRAIYLFHTDIRKWDDIGYNFVIDPAGVLYQARDPQGVAAPDRIKGAHFCGKNSYTMGVCLLGHYQMQPPSSAAISTLLRLLTWKLHKEGLSPVDSLLHPPGSPTATWLPVIAPHRLGCATACPGDSVASRMEWIRFQVLDSLALCPVAGLRPLLQMKEGFPSGEWFDVAGRADGGMGWQRHIRLHILWDGRSSVRKQWQR